MLAVAGPRGLDPGANSEEGGPDLKPERFPPLLPSPASPGCPRFSPSPRVLISFASIKMYHPESFLGFRGQDGQLGEMDLSCRLKNERVCPAPRCHRHLAGA